MERMWMEAVAPFCSRICLQVLRKTKRRIKLGSPNMKQYTVTFTNVESLEYREKR
jgi:hypothetical protein